jgi:hypothetical protein
MKYPKYKLAFPGKHSLVFKGHPMTQFDGYTLGTYASGNGIVSANKTKGFWGESAELFQSAGEYSTFCGFSANKGTIEDTTYTFGKGDDVVTGYFSATDPYNPLGLPPYTLRLKYTDGFTPTFLSGNGVQVSQSPNIWDLTYENEHWTYLLKDHTNLLEVIGGNTKNVSDLYGLLQGCVSLTDVSTFDTTNVLSTIGMFLGCSNLSSVAEYDLSHCNMINYMFSDCHSLSSIPSYSFDMAYDCVCVCWNCSSLNYIPNFNFGRISRSDWMFRNCINVSGGITEMYNKLSNTQSLTSHPLTFGNCGTNTQTGSAELAQIPNDWK